MKLIFALGNNGAKFNLTRHNVGFAMLDKFARQHGVAFQPKSKFYAEIAEISHSGEKILLVKPTTFYNDSGLAARALFDFYKLTLDDLLVIHDDAMLDFGKIRTRQGGRDAGNNGLKSLHRHVGENFWHIRIGTDSLLRKQIGDTDFVLGKFNADEQKILNDWAASEIIEFIEKWLNQKLEATSVKL